MTFSEFKEMANESLIVRCRTVQERYNALTLFKAAGIEIRHKIIDRLQIDSQEDDSIYLHPGSYNGIVSCFINPYVFYVKHTIEYCEIENLIELPWTDDRSDKEFSADLASLFGMQST